MELLVIYFIFSLGYWYLVYYMFLCVVVLENGLLYSILIIEFLYECKVFCVWELFGKLKWIIDFVVFGFFLRFLDIKLDENEKGLFDVLVYLYLLLFISILWFLFVFFVIILND